MVGPSARRWACPRVPATVRRAAAQPAVRPAKRPGRLLVNRGLRR